jgi:hypothetical protein
MGPNPDNAETALNHNDINQAHTGESCLSSPQSSSEAEPSESQNGVRKSLVEGNQAMAGLLGGEDEAAREAESGANPSPLASDSAGQSLLLPQSQNPQQILSSKHPAEKISSSALQHQHPHGKSSSQHHQSRSHHHNRRFQAPTRAQQQAQMELAKAKSNWELLETPFVSFCQSQREASARVVVGSRYWDGFVCDPPLKRTCMMTAAYFR